MSQTYTTIIIADSRGKGLEEFIGAHPTPITHQYVVEIMPGKSIPELKQLTIDTIARYDLNFSYIVIFAGICGLTEKSQSGTSRILRYPDQSREAKVDATINTIYSLKYRFRERLNFCLIVPASLPAYFTRHNPDEPVPDYLQTEQHALETDIDKINKIISALNTSANTNINLISRFQRKSKKKRQCSGKRLVYRRVIKFTDQELPDGVHFSPKLKAVCFSLIVDTTIRDLGKFPNTGLVSHRLQPWPVGAVPLLPCSLSEDEDTFSLEENPLNVSQDSQDNSDRDWDFKGRKKFDQSRA
jgi:hypothetical protein